MDCQEFYGSLLKPLVYMLTHCESHNIPKLKPWFKRILEQRKIKGLGEQIMENMGIMFRRLCDDEVEDQCFELMLGSLTGEDAHLKQCALRVLPYIVEYIPIQLIKRNFLPALQSLSLEFEGHIPRQIDLLVAISHLSDRCDGPTLQSLLLVAARCSAIHPAIVHSKSRLVQRILTCDVGRLSDPIIITHHLLNPLILGLALPELSPAHFDDVMSSCRILLDIVEQIRYEKDAAIRRPEQNGRLCNRRVSMSSNHLPRLLITAAGPRASISGDRKMSFLSADGRLEDPSGRRESKDSRCSIESEISLRIGNGSDASDDSCMSGQQVRRKSWLEGYSHSQSVSLERPPSYSFDRSNNINKSDRNSERRSRTRSPTQDDKNKNPRPNSFTNLGHNLACTLWKSFY
uniref:Uncharacterized protein n=1 Tax=Acrobeloides nanus TaxID=290746 RepID=A0A914DXT5_9BILA